MFDRFRQADSSSTRPHQGLGLGLAIVRHLVEMHGGRVSAENREDRSGARMRVEFPRVEPWELLDAPSPPEGLASPVSLKGVRVLVVDDEVDGREVVGTILRRSGAQPVLAASAEEALALIDESRPDVVLTDIEMPGTDGYMLLERLRALAGADLRVAALTAYAAPTDRDRALDAGFALHIAKPIRAHEVVAAVAQLCRPNGGPTRANGPDSEGAG